MTNPVELTPQNLTPEFVSAYADTISVRPSIIPTGSNSYYGAYRPWRSALKDTVENYIRAELVTTGELPTGVHVLKTGDPKLRSHGSGYTKYRENIVKFPDEAPPVINESGLARFVDVWPLECDAGLGYFTGDDLIDQPPSVNRSRQLLRRPFLIGSDSMVERVYRIAEHLQLTDELARYLLELVISFDRAHEFPSNLVLIYKVLVNIENPTQEAIGLRNAIESLYLEVFENKEPETLDYDWRPLLHDVNCGGILSTQLFISNKAKWDQWRDIAERKRLPEVLCVQYRKTYVADSYWVRTLKNKLVSFDAEPRNWITTLLVLAVISISGGLLLFVIVHFIRFVFSNHL